MQNLGTEVSQHPIAREIDQKLRPVGIWGFVAATLLAAFYLATSLYISSHRLLWVDEILTVLNTRLPSWTTIWKAAAQGADGLPPIYFMLVRPFDDLLGHTDLSIRVLSALALTAGLLLTFGLHPAPHGRPSRIDLPGRLNLLILALLRPRGQVLCALFHVRGVGVVDLGL